ncbi:MAG TPA: glycosyltransferase family 4 protein, partial [Candidatus Eisenbacteria bacterium]
MLIHAAVDNDLHPPRFGGTQRSFGLYRGLARRHTVRVLCVVPNRTPGPSEVLAAGVTLVRRKAWYTSATWRLEQAGLAPSFLAAYRHRGHAAAWLGALPGRPDVLAADVNLAGVLERGEARLRVYTSHNVEYDYFRLVKSRVIAARFWAERMRRLEARAVARADLTVVCTDEDAGRIRELYQAPAGAVAVIPNGFDETRVTAPDEAARLRARAALGLGEREYAALFLGSDTPFNRDGLRRLTDHVVPALAGAGFRLMVVGGVTR